jgi:hypothetical protein
MQTNALTVSATVVYNVRALIRDVFGPTTVHGGWAIPDV